MVTVMLRLRFSSAVLALLVVLLAPDLAESQTSKGSFLGMDRNDYPGDADMTALRKTFAFTGYWLNNPPGANQNTWTGQRKALANMGYGFLLLFNGREYAQLKASGNAAGRRHERRGTAVRSARQEGFPAKAICFWIRSRVGACCPSNAPIFMRGLTLLRGPDIAPESTARGSPFANPAASRS